jgi:hypothetical protein
VLKRLPSVSVINLQKKEDGAENATPYKREHTKRVWKKKIFPFYYFAPLQGRKNINH